MKITIEPTEPMNGALHYSTVSISYPSDHLDIETMMTTMVTAIQAWGFMDESIAEFLETDFATDRGLIKE